MNPEIQQAQKAHEQNVAYAIHANTLGGTEAVREVIRLIQDIGERAALMLELKKLSIEF